MFFGNAFLDSILYVGTSPKRGMSSKGSFVTDDKLDFRLYRPTVEPRALRCTALEGLNFFKGLWASGASESAVVIAESPLIWHPLLV